MDKSIWHNTGSNGQATHVYIRQSGSITAEIKCMPYRYMVTIYFGKDIDQDHEGIPFPTNGNSLGFVKLWCDSFIAREHSIGKGL